MSPRLAGKVALITGASRGIGRATALALAREGSSVIVNYVGNAAAAREVVTEIEGLGQRAIALQADVGNPSDIKKLIDQAVAAFERVDILVCNAGLLMMKDLASTTTEDFDKSFAVNVKGPYFLAQVGLFYCKTSLLTFSWLTDHDRECKDVCQTAAALSSSPPLSPSLPASCPTTSCTLRPKGPSSR